MSSTQDTPRSDRQKLIADLRQLAQAYEDLPEDVLPTPVLDAADTLTMRRHLTDASAFATVALQADEHHARQHDDGRVFLQAVDRVGEIARTTVQITLGEVEQALARGHDVSGLADLYEEVAALTTGTVAKAA